ncbi:MAG: hypothetical protein DWQ05_20740 [Calditrichaeota bacterium]|nr:MAG: hypothetical protein DWQ05_20740 [Calditrichota bacterium]
MNFIKNLSYLFAILILSSGLYGQGSMNKVTIHGYGGWSYGKTDHNNYLNGVKDGNYEQTTFALNTTAQPSSSLRIIGQIEWLSNSSILITELDYAFASWSFSIGPELRLGRVKHPFGLYAEIYNIGTVRPFFSLPQGIYGYSDIIAEGFNGAGLTNSHYSQSSNWGIQYDVYFGQFDYKSSEIWEELEESPNEEETSEFELERATAVGGRLNVFTGIEGLKLGVSAYFGENKSDDEEAEEESEESEESSTRAVAGTHLEYMSDRVSLRSEYAYLTDGEGDNSEKVNAFYLEIGVKVTEKLQLAGRYDHSSASISEIEEEELDSLFKHRDFGLGINYWFSSSFAVKFSYHFVDGNRFATPGDIIESLEANTLDEKTNLIQFGTQFSF